MRLEDVGLWDQPFRTQGWPVKFVKYRSQQEALSFLRKILNDDRSVGLLCGPISSGKSTLVRQFVEELPSHLAVAVVDAARIKTSQLLTTILAQFGYQVALHSTDELLSLLNVLVVQQTRANQAPVLIIENINSMYPSALRALCKLAALKAHNRFALRIILVSNRDISSILASPGMRSIAERLVGEFAMGPLTAKEALTYLYLKMTACGVAMPDSIMPLDVCDALHLASDGWPGLLDELALQAIARAERMPIRVADIYLPAINESVPVSSESQTLEIEADEELPTLYPADSLAMDFASGDELQTLHAADAVTDKREANNDLEQSSTAGPLIDESEHLPRLFITRNGKTLQEIIIQETKILIGRSPLCDVIIDDEFASKHHALLIRSDDDIFLLDLNSRNGTLVNSRQVNSTMLRHNDIISLGNHGIKLLKPNAQSRSGTKTSDAADTANMKSVDDMRRLVAEKKLQIATGRKSG